MDPETTADNVLDRTGFVGLQAHGGQAVLTAKPPHDLVVAIAAALVESIGDAPNYQETPISMDCGDFTLTVQRLSGRTPHQLRRTAEDERDRARSLAVHLEQENAELTRKVEHLTEVCQRIVTGERAYKTERDAALDRLDRLHTASDLYLSSTEDRPAERLERLTDEIDAAQHHLAQPRHDSEPWSEP